MQFGLAVPQPSRSAVDHIQDKGAPGTVPDGRGHLMSNADDAHTWDELVNQNLLLTEHIQVLYAIEAALNQQELTNEQRRLEMLKRAREFAAFKTSSDIFPEVPFPSEAGRATPWKYQEIEDIWYRMYEGREAKAGPASAQISGIQRSDGLAIERKLAIRIHDRLTADEARQFASLLIAEANEIDRLNAG